MTALLRNRGLWAWFALAMLAAWLWWPALNPVHVEGFSASIVALGLHLAQGTLADFFPSQPMNTEYFGLTKLGAVLGVAALAKIGIAGETAMRMLMALGAALLIGGSARLVRYWSGAPWLVVAAALVLIPGVAESSFFFNDNMLGAGLLVAALAVFCDRRAIAAALLAGALIGLAVTVRTDLVLATPAILLMAWEREPLPRAMVTTAAVAAAAVVTLWLCYALVGATPFDAVRVGAVAVDLWGRSGDAGRHIQALLLYLGLPGLLLLLLGLRVAIGVRDWRRLALLLGVPLLINLALAGKIWEARQLLPLTPFLATLVAFGGQRLIADWRNGQRAAPAIFGAAILAILFAPPALRAASDGPHALVGRVAAMADWASWQARIRRNFTLIDSVIAATPAGGSQAILTDYWDEDRYLHLRLIEQGFRAIPQPAACNAIGETLAKDGRTILHLSPHQTFLPNADALYPLRLSELALPCLGATRSEPVLIASDDRVARITRGDMAPAPRGTANPSFALARLSPVLLDRLGEDHERAAREERPGAYRTVAAAIVATRARTGFGERR